MTNDDLRMIEDRLRITLPEFYRRAAIDGRLANVLNSDATSVVAINEAYRSGEFGDLDWPNQRLAFGNDGAGDSFCLDLTSDNRRVLSRDHETLEISVLAHDFDPWLAGLEE